MPRNPTRRRPNTPGTGTADRGDNHNQSTKRSFAARTALWRCGNRRRCRRGLCRRIRRRHRAGRRSAARRPVARTGNHCLPRGQAAGNPEPGTGLRFLPGAGPGPARSLKRGRTTRDPAPCVQAHQRRCGPAHGRAGHPGRHRTRARDKPRTADRHRRAGAARGQDHEPGPAADLAQGSRILPHGQAGPRMGPKRRGPSALRG